MVAAVLSGALDGAAVETEPVFGLAIPAAVEGVPAEVLRPWLTWEDRAAYDQAAARLADMFVEAFKPFAPQAGPEVLAAGPRRVRA